MHIEKQEKYGKIGGKYSIYNTIPVLKINFQVIKRAIVTIINCGQIILIEKMDKSQIGHVQVTWSVLCLVLGKAASVAFERQGVGSKFEVQILVLPR